MATRALDRTHAVTPRPVIDHEFVRLQEWYKPRRLRQILEEWHARYEPWAYQHPDERALVRFVPRHEIHDVAEVSQCQIAGDVQRALNQLAMREPMLYDVIVGFYLDVEAKQDKHVVYWESRQKPSDLAAWHGVHISTIYRREIKARKWMAEYLGWQPPGSK